MTTDLAQPVHRRTQAGEEMKVQFRRLLHMRRGQFDDILDAKPRCPGMGSGNQTRGVRIP